jgi:hypothetical protein
LKQPGVLISEEPKRWSKLKKNSCNILYRKVIVIILRPKQIIPAISLIMASRILSIWIKGHILHCFHYYNKRGDFDRTKMEDLFSQ